MDKVKIGATFLEIKTDISGPLTLTTWTLTGVTFSQESKLSLTPQQLKIGTVTIDAT